MGTNCVGTPEAGATQERTGSGRLTSQETDRSLEQLDYQKKSICRDEVD